MKFNRNNIRFGDINAVTETNNNPSSTFESVMPKEVKDNGILERYGCIKVYLIFEDNL